jgi:hypothetical protein
VRYIELVQPRRDEIALIRHDYHSFLDPSCPLVTAKGLKLVAGTRFRGTDDIIGRLRYDATNKILFIFHHAAFLKGQLRLSEGCGPGPSGLDCLKV